MEHRTGIEGWFDVPGAYDVEHTSATAPAPPRWKQTVTIFLVFFPASVVVNWILTPHVGGWPLPLRVLTSVLVTLPFMTYLGLPWITRRMDWFLNGRPSP